MNPEGLSKSDAQQEGRCDCEGGLHLPDNIHLLNWKSIRRDSLHDVIDSRNDDGGQGISNRVDES